MQAQSKRAFSERTLAGTVGLGYENCGRIGLHFLPQLERVAGKHKRLRVEVEGVRREASRLVHRATQRALGGHLVKARKLIHTLVLAERPFAQEVSGEAARARACFVPTTKSSRGTSAPKQGRTLEDSCGVSWEG